jgi:uncharacterized membrane protein
MMEMMIRTSAAMIDAIAACMVAFYAFRSLRAAIARDTVRARLLMADGVVGALTLSVAASLLKTIGLHSWHQIGMFAFVLAFRTAMKHVFALERRMIEASLSARDERAQ